MTESVAYLLFAVFYLLPSIIGWVLHHRQLPYVIIINVLLGWTVVGWVAAFIWAAIDTRFRR